MKKSFYLFFTIVLTVLGLVLASCSGFNESTSLSLTFSGSDFAQNSARNISVGSDYDGYYIVVSVLGDYTETKSLKITDGGTYTIEFDSVPVGAEIYVRADVYNFESNFIHTYTGTSSKQIVFSGDNTINLSMKNFASGIAYSDNSTITKNNVSTSYNEEYTGSPILKMIFFPNGKYQIVKDAETSPTVDDVISEGIWQGSFDASGTIYITECVYKNVTISTNDNGMKIATFGENVIVENPSAKGFYYYLNPEPEMNNESLTIKLINGLSLTQQTS